MTMPKMKTNSGAKKRFRVTGSGRIKFKKAKKSHILTNKSTKVKRKMRATGYLVPQDAEKVRGLIPYK